MNLELIPATRAYDFDGRSMLENTEVQRRLADGAKSFSTANDSRGEPCPDRDDDADDEHRGRDHEVNRGHRDE